MIILDKTRQRKIHHRRIETVIYEGVADTIVVEGSLQDERFLDTHQPSGEIRPPFTVHHMIIRMAGNLKNSCWVWREDGPLARKLMASE